MFFLFFTCFLILTGCYVLWQRAELAKFRCTAYSARSAKLRKSHRVAVLSDVHAWRYGAHNERLIEAVKKAEPELILITGDLIVYSRPELFPITEELVGQLIQIAPVYFANGNHESRLEQPEHENHAAYQALKQKMTALGVHIVNNAGACLYLGKDRVTVYGLELPLSYYKKGVDTPLAGQTLQELLGAADASAYDILLAHTPKYVPEYLDWGADLCLSGHYHGGLVCLPLIGSVISPQFQLFPKYSFGQYTRGEQTAITSRGLGTHTFHVRIFNRAELLLVTLLPTE